MHDGCVLLNIPLVQLCWILEPSNGEQRSGATRNKQKPKALNCAQLFCCEGTKICERTFFLLFASASKAREKLQHITSSCCCLAVKTAVRQVGFHEIQPLGQIGNFRIRSSPGYHRKIGIARQQQQLQ